MNSHEFNKMNMFTAVKSVLQLYGAVTGKIGALSDATAKFYEKLEHIARHDAQYTTTASGATAAKNGAADTLIDLILRIANALLVLGNNTGNEQLKAECRVTPSMLRHIRTLKMITICGRISELARQYAVELSGYGVTKQDIQSCSGLIESFRKTRSEQQQRLTEGKSARDLLYDDFAEADAILKNQIDPLMELVKHNDAGFYNQYKAARVIWNLHGRSAKNGKTTVFSEAAPTVLETMAA
jgi:hypothetical protein